MTSLSGQWNHCLWVSIAKWWKRNYFVHKQNGMSAVTQGLGCVSHFLQEQRTPWGVGLPWSLDSKRSLKCNCPAGFLFCKLTLRHKQSWKNSRWNDLGLTHAEKQELFFFPFKRGKVVIVTAVSPRYKLVLSAEWGSILRSVHFPESWDINQHWASKLQTVCDSAPLEMGKRASPLALGQKAAYLYLVIELGSWWH